MFIVRKTNVDLLLQEYFLHWLICWSLDEVVYEGCSRTFPLYPDYKMVAEKNVLNQRTFSVAGRVLIVPWFNVRKVSAQRTNEAYICNENYLGGKGLVSNYIMKHRREHGRMWFLKWHEKVYTMRITLTRPYIISYKTAPRHHQSTVLSYSCFRRTSGARYYV